MKIKLLILGACLGASLFSGCNDELSSIGTSIQPSDDTIAVYTDTFRIKTTTVLLDSIYAKTTAAQLGELYDPVYGNLKSDFMCQLYCPSGFKFEHTPIDGKIDSVLYRIYYIDMTGSSYNGAWAGDSLAPMRAEIFKITSPLEKNYYTDFDVNQYCDMSQPLGSKTYTAFNASVPDSVRFNTLVRYTPSVDIKIPVEFGQNFYDETINNPGSFASQEAFNEFFPGIYATTTFGSGNILSVSSSSLQIYYTYMTEGYLGNDSLALGVESFSTTQEVIQRNHFSNMDMSHLLADQQYTYLKTPAGVCTKVTIPTSEIAEIMSDRIINNIPLTLKAMPQAESEFTYPTPTYLLILPEDSVKTFFEEGRVEDKQTSYLASNSTTDKRTYTLSNFSNLMKKQIDEHPDQDLELLVIPVERTTESNSYTGETYSKTITHYMAPSGATLRKDDEVMQLYITSCKYAEKEK